MVKCPEGRETCRGQGETLSRGRGQADMQDGRRKAQTTMTGKEKKENENPEPVTGQQPSPRPSQDGLLESACALCTLGAHKIIKLSKPLS